jgi:hypothetical protein
MLVVDLIPEGFFIEQQTRRRIRRLSYIVVGQVGLFLSLWAILMLFIGWYWLANRDDQSGNAQDLAILYQRVAADKDKLMRLVEAAGIMEKERHARLYATKVLDELPSIMPAGVTLRSMQVSSDLVLISGVAKDLSVVSEAVASLNRYSDAGVAALEKMRDLNFEQDVFKEFWIQLKLSGQKDEMPNSR